MTEPSGIFALNGPVGFAPHYAPKRIYMGKERRLDREKNFCGSESVEDTGSNNRDIHLSGYIQQSEKAGFNDLLDSGEPHIVVTPIWSGEVLVEDGDLEGPVSWDPFTRDYLYKYSLNIVSTGKNE